VKASAFKLTTLAFSLFLIFAAFLAPQDALALCDENIYVDTGIGCVPYNAPDLAAFIVRIVVGIAGGIALLLLIAGGVQFVSSGGDPDSIDEAKQRITAAVSGLLLIIFSLVVLKVIGVDILDLPGFDPSGGGVILPGP